MLLSLKWVQEKRYYLLLTLIAPFTSQGIQIGNHKLLEPDRVGATLMDLRDNFATNVTDSAYQDAVKFSHFRKTA